MDENLGISRHFVNKSFPSTLFIII